MSAQESPPSLQRENGTRKRESQGGRPPKRQRTRKEKPVKEGSSQEVLLADVSCAVCGTEAHSNFRTAKCGGSGKQRRP